MPVRPVFLDRRRKMDNKLFDLRAEAKRYHETLGCNVLALENKKPVGEWKQFMSVKQSLEDIETLRWDKATGIGFVCGVNDLCALDFDKVQNEDSIAALVEDLGLGINYEWAAQSGSGNGFHIWLRLQGDRGPLYSIYGKEAGVIKLKPKPVNDDVPYQHLEVRLRDCQTAVPPSLHESGQRYRFLNKTGGGIMAVVSIEKLIEVIRKHCILPEEMKTVPAPRTAMKKKGKHEFNRYTEKRLSNAVNHLAASLPPDCYDEWFSIGMGLASLGETGRRYFLELSLKNPNYHDTEVFLNDKFNGFLRDYDGRTTLGTVFHIAKKYGMKEAEVVFWFLDEDSKIQLIRNKFIEFLTSNGFFRWYPAKESIFVRLVGNIVEEVFICHIQDFVLDYIRNVLPDPVEPGITRGMLENAILRSVNTYFGENFLRSLPTLDLEFQKDSAASMYFFYSNCFVEVTPSGIMRKPYTELCGCIWKETIMQRVFEPGPSEGDFSKFISNICGSDAERVEAFKSMYGYMLHHFKIPSLTKAVILIDEKLSSGAAGGTGKSIIGNSFKYFRKWQFEDGKNFDFKKGFPFQKTEIGDQVLFFNDIGRYFDFEKLFNLITDDWTIEKKHRQAISIRKEDAPKIIIASNYMVKGSEESHMRRQYIFALADFYGAKRQPVQDFGKEFFGDDWLDEDWRAFDNFGLECAQLFLQKGLIEINFDTVIVKRLAAETDGDFAEFIADQDWSEPIVKKELLEKFQSAYPGHEKMMLNTFSKWVERYAKFYGYEYDKDRKVKGERVYFLNKR